jgi:sec-independent protein translocase protein TatC
MADDTEELRPEDEEVAGGAVKSFLEHLEDLRWTIIKCSVAIFIGMCVCLFGVNKLIAIMKWPLDRAALISENTNQVVTVKFGGIQVGSYTVSNNYIGSLYLGTNHFVVVDVEPVSASVMNNPERPTSAAGPTTGPNGSLLLSARVLPVSGKQVPKGPDLIFLDPSAPFISSLHLAFFGGLFLGSPFVLYFVGQFLMPALKVREKKYFLRAFYIGGGLFAVGVCAAYFGVMPRALKFAELYANWMGVQVPDWRAETYFSFLVKFMIGMGLGFELPVVLLALVKIGILDYAKLKAMRRYMIVINSVLGAVLTTPEVFTQLVMLVVLQVLFEISVFIAWYWERQEKQRMAAEQSNSTS